jgi:hypothetical protein
LGVQIGHLGPSHGGCCIFLQESQCRSKGQNCNILEATNLTNYLVKNLYPFLCQSYQIILKLKHIHTWTIRIVNFSVISYVVLQGPSPALKKSQTGINNFRSLVTAILNLSRARMSLVEVCTFLRSLTMALAASESTSSREQA